MYLPVHEEGVRGGQIRYHPVYLEYYFSFQWTPSEEKSCRVGVLLAFIRAIAAHARPIHSQNLHRKYFWIKPKYYQIQIHSQNLQQKCCWIKPRYWQIQIFSQNLQRKYFWLNQNTTKYKSTLRICSKKNHWLKPK